MNIYYVHLQTDTVQLRPHYLQVPRAVQVLAVLVLQEFQDPQFGGTDEEMDPKVEDYFSEKLLASALLPHLEQKRDINRVNFKFGTGTHPRNDQKSI